MLNVPALRHWTADGIASLLASQLHTEVRIGDVRVGLFNRITLNDVVLNDRQGRPLLTSESLAAKIALRPLLKGKVQFRSVSLLDTRFSLLRDRPDSATNFQFILDAFAGKDPRHAKPIDVQIGSLILRRCTLSYTDKATKPTPGLFNPRHLSLTNLDASISLKQLTPDSLNLRVRSLSAHEQSGLEICQLKLRLAANRSHAELREFQLEMPQSSIEQPLLALDYDLNSPHPLISTLCLQGNIHQAKIATDDVACFHPVLQGLQRELTLSTSFYADSSQLSLQRTDLQTADNHLRLKANATLLHQKGKVKSIQAHVKDFHLNSSLVASVYQKITHKTLPVPATTLSYLDYQGTLNYVSDGNVTVDGQLQTAAGRLRGRLTKMGDGVEGNLEVEGIKLALLANDKNLPTTLTATLSGRADFNRPKQPDIEADLKLHQMVLNGHMFRDITLTGTWNQGNFHAQINAADPALQIVGKISGHHDGHQFTAFDLTTDIAQLRPGTLGLTGKFAQSTYSGHIQAAFPAFPSNTLPYGMLQMENFSVDNGEHPIRLDNLRIHSESSPLGGKMNIESDFATINLEGPLSLPLLREAAEGIIANALPGLLPNRAHVHNNHEWHLQAEIRSTDILQPLLHIPLHLNGPLTINGQLHGDGRRTSITASTGGIAYDAVELKDVRCYFQHEGNQLHALLQGIKSVGGADMKLALNARSDDGHLRADLSWDGTGTPHVSGTLSTLTDFQEEGGRALHTTIFPSHITVGDSIWNIDGGDLIYSDKELSINNFSLAHRDQSLKIDGRLSANPEDSIVAILHKMDIEYILGLVDFNTVDFAGQATGTLSLGRRNGYPQVSANLLVPNFHFNQGPMGDLSLVGGYDTHDKRIDINGLMINPDTGWTDVKGYISLLEKGLDLHIKSEQTNLRFLRRYVDGIFGDFEARATGYCHLFGPFKKLDFEGEERASGEATILATGVRYRVENGHVAITPGTFSFTNFSVTDQYGGQGVGTGQLRHRHLKDLNYAFEADVSNLLVYDQGKTPDLPFYSTSFGTGHIAFQGYPGSFEASLQMRPERGTTLTYIVDTPETFGDVSLVTYHDITPKSLPEMEVTPIASAPPQEETSTDIRLNMQFDVNPTATLRVILDEKSGDNITIHGSGPIRATYYNKGAFRMYGALNIDQGTYKMTIQDVIRKDFSLTPGGRIVFGGDPFDGDMNMQAVYTVNSASLSDLTAGSSFSQSSVRVNCLLNFSGKVKNPQVSFDLDLPSVNEDEKQLVRNLISTEEEMTTQVLYLLGIGRFFSYNNTQLGTEQTAGAHSSAAMKSFLSSTLSNQLNQIISDAVGSSNWSFGANVSTGSVGTKDMEVEGLLSGRLFNNRLLVNGNIGYRDNSFYSTHFIGDFDVQYLLTPGGSIRLKAYSETNDRYFTKAALTTQGVGVQLGRDFSNLKDLFKIKKRSSKKKKYK